MKRPIASRWLAGSFVALTLLLLCVPPSTQVVEAFDKTWISYGSDCGLWDDAPGAGWNNESAFFWVETPDKTDDRCTYASSVNAVGGTSLKLSVRAAVNDGATLTVALRQPRFADLEPKPELEPIDYYTCPETPLIASIVIHGNPFVALHQPYVRHKDSLGEFVTAWVDLPPGASIDKVCITLDDEPNDIASERASALIDYIKISQSLAPPPPICEDPCLIYADPTLVWQETFQRAK